MNRTITTMDELRSQPVGMRVSVGNGTLSEGVYIGPSEEGLPRIAYQNGETLTVETFWTLRKPSLTSRAPEKRLGDIIVYQEIAPGNSKYSDYKNLLDNSQI